MNFVKRLSTLEILRKRHLNDVYGVETKLRGKTLSFKHPERERFIRANKLGADYEREGLEHVFARQIEREQEHERAISRNEGTQDRKSTRLNSSHVAISYAVFCLKKK